MRNIICFTTLLLLLNGCSNKSDDPLSKSFDSHRIVYKNLQKTEKAQLYDQDVTKALVTATYMYVKDDTLKNDQRDEVFIIGVYLEEEQSNRIGGDYRLSLEGTYPKSIKPISKESTYLKGVPFVTVWNSYYLVRFPHTSKKSFKVTFESRKYGKKEMHFAKQAKYLEKQAAF